VCSRLIRWNASENDDVKDVSNADMPLLPANWYSLVCSHGNDLTTRFCFVRNASQDVFNLKLRHPASTDTFALKIVPL
jgi:hypothetical protein